MYGQVRFCPAEGCGQEELDYAGMIAGWAKAELLREKVKQRMEKEYGKQLDRAADLIVEVVTARAERGRGLQEKEEELSVAFGQLYQDSEEGE